MQVDVPKGGSSNRLNALAIVRGPTWVSMDNQPAPIPGSTEVCLMQFQFPGSVTVHSIQFKNYYTHTICIKSRPPNTFTDSPTETDNIHDHYLSNSHSDGCLAQPTNDASQARAPWDLSIKRKILMPEPECEDGSQSCFTILASESVTSWTNVSSFIFILRQPSKCWKTFSIQEVDIRGKQNLPSPVQLHENKEQTGSADGEETDLDTESKADLDRTSAPVQRLLKVPQVANSVSDIIALFKHFQTLDI